MYQSNVLDSKLTPRSFYNYLLNQLGCKAEFPRNTARNALHKLIEIMGTMQNHKAVVLVYEAHLLPKEMLEETRFLLNYKMLHRCHIQKNAQRSVWRNRKQH